MKRLLPLLLTGCLLGPGLEGDELVGSACVDDGALAVAVALPGCEPAVPAALSCDATEVDAGWEVDSTGQASVCPEADQVPGCQMVVAACGVVPGAAELVDDGTGPVAMGDLPACDALCGE